MPKSRSRGTGRGWGARRRRGSARRFGPVIVLSLIGLGLVVLAGVTSQRREPPPEHDLCRIFAERPRWFRAVRRTARVWDLPEPIQMALLQQESGLRGWARPPRRRWWGLPADRSSTAFGYAQALDGTWNEYRTASGNQGARRDDFADAVDFVGWYIHRLHVDIGLDKSNTRELYLAYHEGPRGYRERRFADKPHVLRAAARVSSLARTYAEQYEVCAPALRRRQRLGLTLRILTLATVLWLLAFGVFRQHKRLRLRTRRR